MITLTHKLKKESKEDGFRANNLNNVDGGRRVSVRDRLLVKEVQEMEQHLPNTCRVSFPDPNALHEFVLLVCPDEGYWQGGRFQFSVNVSDEYNMAVSRHFVFGKK